MVATPKRLAHLVKAKQIDLTSVQFLILDEADKLFELGFVSHIDAIIHACSNPGIVSIVIPFRPSQTPRPGTKLLLQTGLEACTSRPQVTMLDVSRTGLCTL